MHTVTDVRCMRGLNCDSDHFLIRMKCVNKIRKMQERCKKRMKLNSKKLEDAVISQKFKYDMMRL
jgi:hypothetical protein